MSAQKEFPPDRSQHGPSRLPQRAAVVVDDPEAVSSPRAVTFERLEYPAQPDVGAGSSTSP